jgi:hypothetical protein
MSDDLSRRSNPPRKHHYLPEFYLRQWAAEGGQLVRFAARNDAEVTARRAFPAGVGYLRDLYRAPGVDVDEWAAQQLEWKFFQHLDNDAERALQIVLGNQPWKWDNTTRSNWTRFLLSFLHRTPRHVVALGMAFERIYRDGFPEIEEEYLKIRAEDMPDTLTEWLAVAPEHFVQRSLLGSLPDLIDNREVGQRIASLDWGVVDLAKANLSLLTSDNALVLYPLAKEGAHVALPVSPTKLFFAADPQTWRDLRAMKARDIIIAVNRLTVQRADEIVVAHNLSQARFIKSNFGINRVDTMGTGIRIASRRHVNLDSAARPRSN